MVNTEWFNPVPTKNAWRFTKNPRKVIIFGAIQSGHKVMAKFHHGTNKGSTNDTPDDAYLCLLDIDKDRFSI